MSYKLGIDVGSTTLKTVVLNEDDNIIEKSYARHFSKVREATVAHLRTLEPLLRGQPLAVAVTGSAGLGIAKGGGLAFVQEVFATAGAVKRTLPQTDVVIELGGEDAKILFLHGTLEERMNGTCAGGTGAFIDQMATLLDVSAGELDEMSLRAEKIYPIASRCGVFAKSDIQPLLNQGAKREDIAASIFQAVVEQTITGLAQGREIKGNVLFLGGPLSFLKGLQARFLETLRLDPEQALFPALAPYFVALGSAYYAGELGDMVSYDELIARLEASGENVSFSSRPPLFRDEGEYESFRARHASMTVEEADAATYQGDAWLGIDAGSTTTKVVLVGEHNEILYKHYQGNGGNPLPLIREQIGRIHDLCGDHIRVAGSAVTGYGEELMQSAFGIDHGLVETVAHYTAARHFSPAVDFIIDIGGQDIKCFSIKDGSVDSVILNEACSSGCGSFIETFAKSMGYPVADFARLALFSKNPVDLGSRCTVFMNSSVKQAQKDGATVEDISAGLAISVINNAIYKVIRARSADELGEHIVVQGGTFLNDAVLRSFEQELQRDVVRLTISELMGAYGAALYAKEHTAEKSTLITPDDLAAFTHKAVAATCQRCTNRCSLTVNTFRDGSRFVSGNKCEMGAGGIGAADLPNVMRFKYDYVANYPLPFGKRANIGIPLVLNFYENLPFWAEFFSALDCRVTISGQSSRKLYMLGQQTIPSDTVCYPAKLVHGHIEELLRRGVDAIFYPCMTYNFDEGLADNCYNCPVVAYYPEVVQANMDAVKRVKFIHGHLSLNNKKIFIKRIFEFLKDIIPALNMQELDAAANKAYEAHRIFRREVVEAGERALAHAEEFHRPVIVVAGRPYHVDPEINHGVDKMLTTLGFVVLSEDAVSGMEIPFEHNVLNQWTYHARMYHAAKFVTRHKNMEMVQLVSFGCGIDAVTSDEVRDILRAGGKLYTQLKIDEITNLGAAKIRMRSLAAAMGDRA
jgi:predicted CoA-substrate-specific enzyme activase